MRIFLIKENNKGEIVEYEDAIVQSYSLLLLNSYLKSYKLENDGPPYLPLLNNNDYIRIEDKGECIICHYNGTMYYLIDVDHQNQTSRRIMLERDKKISIIL